MIRTYSGNYVLHIMEFQVNSDHPHIWDDNTVVTEAHVNVAKKLVKPVHFELHRGGKKKKKTRHNWSMSEQRGNNYRSVRSSKTTARTKYVRLIKFLTRDVCCLLRAGLSWNRHTLCKERNDGRTVRDMKEWRGVKGGGRVRLEPRAFQAAFC